MNGRRGICHSVHTGAAVKLATGSFLFLLATPVLAQSPDEKPRNLDEIVVTANKFGSSIERAPVAATTVNEKELQLNRIQTVQDVAARVPSLVYNNPSSSAQAYIRGLGSNYSLAGLESAVATYVDGYYLQRQNGAVIDLVDLEGIQVLKGPQGTLYGRNATGGAIVVTTANPTSELGGFANLEYGRFKSFRGQAMLNLPLTSTLAVRFSGQVKHNGDYLTGLLGTSDQGETDSSYGRVKVRWSPTPEFSAVYSFERYRFKSTAFAQRESLPIPYCKSCGLFNLDPQLDAGFYTTTVTPGYNKVRFTSHTLNLLYDGDKFMVNGMLGYRRQATPLTNDQDYLPPNALYTSPVLEKGPNLQGDVYLRTKFDSRLNGLVGASFMREHNNQDVVFTGIFTQGLFVNNNNDVHVNSISFYGELYYDLGSGFKLTGGARWNQDKKSNHVRNNDGARAFFRLPLSAAEFTVSARFRSVTPRAVLSYEKGDTLIYASYSKGERSGGFGSPQVAPTKAVDPESLDNFEIGVKGRTLDDRLSYDAAIFYGIYKDIQVQVVDSITGTVQLQNAAKGRVSGAELNLRYRPVDALNLSGGVTFLDNKFKDFPDANVQVPFASYPTPASYGLHGAKADLSGTVLPRSPRFSAFLAADYTIPVRDFSVRFSAIGRYTSKYVFTAGAGGPLRNDQQKAYAKIDGAIDVDLPGGKTSIGAYATNIFGAHYVVAAASSSFGANYVAPMPPSYGVRMSTRF